MKRLAVQMISPSAKIPVGNQLTGDVLLTALRSATRGRPTAVAASTGSKNRAIAIDAKKATCRVAPHVASKTATMAEAVSSLSSDSSKDPRIARKNQ